jgi:hypothetical protein
MPASHWFGYENLVFGVLNGRFLVTIKINLLDWSCGIFYVCFAGIREAAGLNGGKAPGYENIGC